MDRIAFWRAFFPDPRHLVQPLFPNGKSTQIMKMAERAPLAEWTLYLTRMESGRFAGFSIIGPFAKPGILRDFQGLRPPVGRTPGSAG
jgi:hypothetical protein